MRAQTTTDFAVGMGLFLVTLVVVMGFLPTVFAPFETQTGARALTAERSADRLAEDLLVEEPTGPSVLNDSCTVEFFDGDGSVPAGCRYDSDASDITDALGVQSFLKVNVTVRDGSGVRTVDGTDLAAGPAIQADDDVVSTRRTVLVGGETNHMLVRVWT